MPKAPTVGAGPEPVASPVVERDFSREIDAWVDRLREDPEDTEAIDELIRVTDDWLAADGLSAPSPSECDQRVRLAAWLGKLVPRGPIVHFGRRTPAVAEALAASGCRVASHLDHPARAIGAAICRSGDDVSFKLLQSVEDEVPVESELVVIETAGHETVLPLDTACRFVRPGGWLAVVGSPVVVHSDRLVEAGRFRLSDADAIEPAPIAAGDPELALYRFVCPRGMATRDSAREIEPRAKVADTVPDTFETEHVAINDDPLSSRFTETAHIELTTRCTLRCVYCAVSQPTYRGADMDPARIDDVVRTLRARRARHVVVNGHGETTMVDGWFDSCRKLLDEGMRLSIISNFARLFEQQECDVLCRFEGIEVSVDSADPVLLKKLRRKVDLSTIVHNMSRVRAAALRNGVTAPNFSWSCVVNDDSIWGVRDVVRLGLAAGACHFTFCNLTKYPDVDDALNVQHVTELPREQVVEAREALSAAVAIARAGGAEAYVQPGLVDTMNAAIEEGDRPERPDDGSSPPPMRRYSATRPEGMTRDCLDPWHFALFGVSGSNAVLKPCCWHPPVGRLDGGRDPIELFDDQPMRELREQLLTGNDLNEHCTRCPARGWIEVDRFQDKLRKMREARRI